MIGKDLNSLEMGEVELFHNKLSRSSQVSFVIITVWDERDANNQIHWLIRHPNKVLENPLIRNPGQPFVFLRVHVLDVIIDEVRKLQDFLQGFP